jgi:hypothetical protein
MRSDFRVNGAAAPVAPFAYGVECGDKKTDQAAYLAG